MFKNQRGMTLIELLAVLIILSLIVILVGSIQLFSQKQFSNQAQQVERQSDVRQLLTEMNRELRLTPSKAISAADNSLVIADTVYALQGNMILRNGSVQAENIRAFDVERTGNQLTIEISTERTLMEDTTTVTTTIMLRK
ncbi:prepilin-type N-terminal cleavage/methylation domain-containing protein [Gracilibacillus caseinilyticus]|uniref:Prepilin-type N-terminal cleavage/methylation domain-containing protein n=1 Tax=Gracilibacillus caseinilyticus TaxID=2932256 RepID=A0ABY4ES80_9BACI|nr:prepilin-type N-terminal cleavage/methylation domain-containing protein [Gracilibacillus caseinilyticus]UOQ47286.1 prepilin-type N-terminal cleavage/methylation domain-containing protein [Gracilibacillus caseinilyticus]